ncbi:MAG: hypothetical protein AAF958_05125 [Planctomycetota bacterium]
MKIRLPKLQWVPSASASGARALLVSACDPEHRDRQDGTRGSILRDLDEALAKRSLDAVRFWTTWFDRVLGGTDPRDAAGLVTGEKSDRITVLIAEWWSEWEAAADVLNQQLALRAGPIKTQWDTYGAGIFRHVEKAVWAGSPPDDWWPERIQIVLVHPQRGGGGDVTPRGDSIWFEAMLTDSDPRIPEVLRLAWLTLRVSIRLHLSGRSDALTLHRGWDLASVSLIRRAALDIGLLQEVTAGQLMNFWEFGDAKQAIALETWDGREDDGRPMPIQIARLTKEISSP